MTRRGEAPAQIDPDLEAVLEFLRDSRGFDFGGYKRSSLTRRVRRRMSEVGIDTFGEYLDFLHMHQEEYTPLFNTILINVTAFLRDSDAWTHLRTEVLPAVVAARRPSEQVRVWSAGCASGEEAYSIAMVLAEILGVEQARERLKIYATDVDEEALGQARLATYTDREVAAVPADLREKYFERHGSRQVFHRELRRSVIFGRNDLVRDAPISRVDLLLCRNTLMYFTAETQARILGGFHFALADTGALFLGRAEMLLSHRHLFEPVDLERRFFRKIPRGVRAAALPAGDAGAGRTTAPATEIDRLRAEAVAANPIATLVITPAGQLVLANQRAETMFGLTTRDVGRPLGDLDVAYRPVDLRAALEQAQRERRSVWLREVEWIRSPGESNWLDVQVVPLVGDADASLGCVVYVTDVSRYRKLQAELEYTNRQLETAYEELQSTVEELETTNEELHSTNEELATMNAELSSTNDELQTTNHELQTRSGELDQASGFLESILGSVRSTVIVLDRDVVVQVWNQRAEDLWGLRARETVGQHLLNLDIGLPAERVRPLVRAALAGTGKQDVLPAVDQRGRTIELKVTCSPLLLNRDEVRGVIMVLDEVDGAAAGDQHPIG